MAEPHVVTALTAKRAELAGEIQAAEKRIAQLRADLVHLDATLRLFSSRTKPAKIPAKRPYHRREWFKNGELPRLVLSTLRKATAPAGALELALAAMAHKGLEASDAATLEAVTECVRSYLRRQRALGLVHSERSDGQCLAWELINDLPGRSARGELALQESPAGGVDVQA